MATMSEGRCEGRVVVDVTRTHVWLFLCDGEGKILDQDSFAWPFRMDRKDAAVEVSDLHGVIYDYLNDTCNNWGDEGDAASDGEEHADSD